MTRRGLDDSARMTRWGTITTRGLLGETRLTRRGRLNEDDSTRTTQQGDDSTRMTRWSWLDEDDSTRRWLDEARCVDKDYSMSQGCWQLKGTFVLRILCWKRYLFFPIILNVLFLLKLWSFIQCLFSCFISLINPLHWILKFHFIFIYTIIICIS